MSVGRWSRCGGLRLYNLSIEFVYLRGAELSDLIRSCLTHRVSSLPQRERNCSAVLIDPFNVKEANPVVSISVDKTKNFFPSPGDQSREVKSLGLQKTGLIPLYLQILVSASFP